MARTRGWAATSWIAFGSVTLGLGIWSMHFVGMAAIPVVPAIRYDPWIFAASVAVAIAVAFVALKLAFSLSDSGSRLKKFAVALVMGGAIAAMHYTGMAAAQFAPDSVCTVGAGAIEPVRLAGLIAFNTILVLLATLAIILYDGRIASQKADMDAALQGKNASKHNNKLRHHS